MWPLRWSPLNELASQRSVWPLRWQFIIFEKWNLHLNGQVDRWDANLLFFNNEIYISTAKWTVEMQIYYFLIMQFTSQRPSGPLRCQFFIFLKYKFTSQRSDWPLRCQTDRWDVKHIMNMKLIPINTSISLSWSIFHSLLWRSEISFLSFSFSQISFKVSRFLYFYLLSLTSAFIS